jgi:hypothetical protein
LIIFGHSKLIINRCFLTINGCSIKHNFTNLFDLFLVGINSFETILLSLKEKRWFSSIGLILRVRKIVCIEKRTSSFAS